MHSPCSTPFATWLIVFCGSLAQVICSHAPRGDPLTHQGSSFITGSRIKDTSALLVANNARSGASFAVQSSISPDLLRPGPQVTSAPKQPTRAGQARSPSKKDIETPLTSFEAGLWTRKTFKVEPKKERRLGWKPEVTSSPVLPIRLEADLRVM